MHDQEKSDSAIVAVKRPNKTGTPVAEAVEPRAGTKGNAGQQSAIAHVLIPGGVGIGQELAWLRKFDSGIAS